jgi:UDP-hydrolysing UDP-N-acetyl-D-glucosamine 2-epimerase
MRTIGIVTVGRSDWGIYRPVVERLSRTKGLSVRIIVTGMHLAPEFGSTYRLIEADGYPSYERVESLVASDTPTGIAKSMGLGVLGFAELFSRWRPDILLVLGDRFEMHAAALAALPFLIPVAHIHGGELTEGAIDDALRHSITKLSHLHFPSTPVYAKRIRQLGEESWRITVSGAPGLDHLRTTKRLTPRQFSTSLEWAVPERFALVTYHPVTLSHQSAGHQIDELLAALEATGLPALFTMPNADTNGRIILTAIKTYLLKHPASLLVDNLGTERYLTAMRLAAVMLGNSSSGIIEAASFKLPVVNIGLRQRGRLHAANVIDCSDGQTSIATALRKALTPSFHRLCAKLTNPYDAGGAAAVIARTLKQTPLGTKLMLKHFSDQS